jgi:CubicO group peptidase (beta-lactamase class C family)
VIFAVIAFPVSLAITYGFLSALTGRSQLARAVVFGQPDVHDYTRFPARALPTARPVYRFRVQEGAGIPFSTVRIRQDGALVDRDLDSFLDETKTAAFLVVKGRTLLYERYFHGYARDSTVTSFSIAKAFVSALVGIAVRDGYIGSVDDPVTRYVPELGKRDPRFARITLRNLLSMTSGLRNEDNTWPWQGSSWPYDDATTAYYSPDLRRVALEDTEIVARPNERFDFNGFNTLLLGLVLERTTGRSVSAFLDSTLWKPLGMEADGSWSLDSDADRFEKMESGINGRAIDFAKFGALYLNDGRWRGRSLVPEAWVRGSTDIDRSTDRAWSYEYGWWTYPGERGRNEFAALGNKGAVIYVAPARGVVLVRFGIEYGYDAWPELMSAMARRFPFVASSDSR